MRQARVLVGSGSALALVQLPWGLDGGRHAPLATTPAHPPEKSLSSATKTSQRLSAVTEGIAAWLSGGVTALLGAA